MSSRALLFLLLTLLWSLRLMGQGQQVSEGVSAKLDSFNVLISQNRLEVLDERLANYFEAFVETEKWLDAFQVSRAVSQSLTRIKRYDEALKQLRRFEYLSERLSLGDSQELAANYRYQGNALYRLKRYEEAIKAHRKSERLILRLKLGNDLLAQTRHNLGLCYSAMGKRDSTLISYERGVSLISENSGVSPANQARLLTGLANAHLKLSEPRRALPYARRSLALREQYFTENVRFLSIARNSLASILSMTGSYQEAESLYLAANQGFQALYGELNTLSAAIYNNLAELYYQQGLHNQAISYGQKALEIYRVAFGEGHDNTKSVLTNLAAYKLFAGKLSESIRDNQYLIEIHSGDDHSSEQELARIELNLGAAYLANRQYDKAYEQLAKARVSASAFPALQISVLKNLAEVHFYQARYDSAIGLMDSVESLEGEENSNRGWTLLLKSKVQIARDAYNDALRNIDMLESLQTANPYERFEAKLLRFQLLEKMGQPVEEALKALNEAEEVLEKSSLEAFNQYDKLSFVSNSTDLVTSGVPYAYRQHQETGNARFVDFAWRIAVKAKGRLLSQAMSLSNARSFGGVPSKLTQTESELRARIAFFERSGGDSLFYYRTALTSLLKTFESDYPEYFALKYGVKSVGLSVFQQTLKEQLLINYTQAGDDLYGIALTSDAVSFKRLGDFREISSAVESYYQALQNSEPLSRWSDLAPLVYEQLLQPFAHLLAECSELLVLPDPSIQHLPFEALLTRRLTEAERVAGDFRALPYLLKSHSVSYAYSVMGNSERKVPGLDSPNLVGFAPFSEGEAMVVNSTRSGLQDLPASGTELKVVLESVQAHGGTALGFWGDVATRVAFDSTATEADIIHIASHSFPDFGNGSLAKIAFRASATETDSIDFVYAADIYSKQLKADLVVLSSCESAAGRVYRGEGVFSLARSFLYAGARHVMASQWEVPDEQASQLSEAFYKVLFSDATTDYREALTLAKRALIAEADSKFFHPGYWSNFILIGQ